jgi:hypothetical protein
MISQYIPLKVMQQIMATNANPYVQRNSEHIVCEYRGKDTKKDATDASNYAVYSQQGTSSFESVVFCVRAWDYTTTTRTQDREYIRFIIAERGR